MKSQFLHQLKELPDFDVQMAAIELDTSAKRLKYLSASKTVDAYEDEKFSKFFDNIKNNEAVVTSINDNTDLYELSESSIVVILYEDLTDKFIIFDIQDAKKIENLIANQE